jgi:hypothetical protein
MKVGLAPMNAGLQELATQEIAEFSAGLGSAPSPHEEAILGKWVQSLDPGNAREVMSAVELSVAHRLALAAARRARSGHPQIRQQAAREFVELTKLRRQHGPYTVADIDLRPTDYAKAAWEWLMAQPGAWASLSQLSYFAIKLTGSGPEASRIPNALRERRLAADADGGLKALPLSETA